MAQLTNQLSEGDSNSFVELVSNNANKKLSKESEFLSVTENTNASNDQTQELDSVMSELNRLSKSFMNSYQNLEGQVERLNGELESATKQKDVALFEREKLIDEKASLSERLQNLLSIMPSGVVVIDGAGQVQECNAKAVDILGRPLLGELWINVINRAFLPQADDGYQVSLRDGRKIHIETRGLDNEPGQMVLLTDLTKTFELQAAVNQQRKLSSMGKMIASLAHQIRTPLSAAILYGSHLSSPKINDETKHRFSENLMERLQFMERQITDMLCFVRGERKQKAMVSAKTLIEKVTEISADLADYVEVKTMISEPEKVELMIDEDSIVGALSNLIENACQACEIKPSLSCSDRSVKVTFKLEKNLLVSVKDNGAGISQEVREKIFEPFMTTKSNGNGLGLAVVHGTLVDHGGKIKVDSSKDIGSEFQIMLPIVRVRKQCISNSEAVVQEF